MRRLLALLMTLALLAGSVARADWPVGGKRVCIVDDSPNGVMMVRFMDLPSGEIYVLSVGRGGNVNGYTLQRLGPGGEFAPGWPEAGYDMGQVLKSPFTMGIMLDDSSCVWRAQIQLDGLTSSRFQAQLVRPDVVQLPSFGHAWNATTGPTSLGISSGMAAAQAPGGSYVAFGSKVQRMSRAGSIAPGWPGAGASAPGVTSHCPALCVDGSGGVVVFGASAFVSQPTAQRLDSTGVVHPGWPATGLVLAAGPDDFSADLSFPNFLIPSEPGWFIAGWVTPNAATFSNKHIQLQRFSLNGTLDPTWPANGITVAGPDTLQGVKLIADGLGGVHVLWYASERPRGTHLRADGTFAPGLSAHGVDLAGLDPDFEIPYSESTLLDVVADSAAAGGLLFAYDNKIPPVPAPTYHVRWLNADYTPKASEPARAFGPVASASHVRGVHSDGAGGAYLAWETVSGDTDHIPPFLALWMTRLLASAATGITPHPGALSRLALSAPRPNPARGAVALDVTLPDDSPARVELLDVAGRVQRTQMVQGAGTRAVPLADLASLPPGLYFARVSHARGTAWTRVVLTR